MGMDTRYDLGDRYVVEGAESCRPRSVQQVEHLNYESQLLTKPRSPFERCYSLSLTLPLQQQAVQVGIRLYESDSPSDEPGEFPRSSSCTAVRKKSVSFAI